MYLEDVIEVLKIAPRVGTKEDVPEGNRYIIISDTLSKEMIRALEDELYKDIDD